MKTFGYTKQDEFGNTYYTDEAMSFGERIFKVIHQTKDQFALDKDYKINLEQVPGETSKQNAASRHSSLSRNSCR